MLSCLILSVVIVGACVSFNTRVFLYKLVLNMNYFGFDSGLFLATLFCSLRFRGNNCFFLVTSMFFFDLLVGNIVNTQRRFLVFVCFCLATLSARMTLFILPE